MTLRLILMRHAKSAWDSPTLDDHDRPLNDRGQRSASALGGWLQANAYLPQQVLSSDATRTRETCALVLDGLEQKPASILWRDALYLAPAQVMLDRLRADGTAQCVLMLGHNPGIASFAHMLAQRPPGHSRFQDYPTNATAVIDFDVESWAKVDWGGGQIVDFIVPRDLGVS